jgi:hypothetical protein
LPASISCTLSELSVSLIDDAIQELALLTLCRVKCSFIRSTGMSEFSFSIDSIQVDDMYPDVPIPIVLFCKTGFLESSVTWPGATPVLTQIQEARVAISPITAYLDGCFVSDVLFFFHSICAPAPAGGASGAGPSAPMAIRRLVAPAVKVSFTLKWRTGRQKRHPLDPALRLPFSRFKVRIPSITAATITVPKLSLGPFSGPWSVLSERVTAHITASATDQWLSLVRRVDATCFTGLEGSVRSVANRFRGTVETGRRSAGSTARPDSPSRTGSRTSRTGSARVSSASSKSQSRGTTRPAQRCS